MKIDCALIFSIDFLIVNGNALSEWPFIHKRFSTVSKEWCVKLAKKMCNGKTLQLSLSRKFKHKNEICSSRVKRSILF